MLKKAWDTTIRTIHYVIFALLGVLWLGGHPLQPLLYGVPLAFISLFATNLCIVFFLQVRENRGQRRRGG